MGVISNKRNPIIDFILTCILFIIIPVFFVIAIFLGLRIFRPSPMIIDVYTALGFGCGIGAVFQLSCIFAGALNNSIRVVTNRFYNFFSTLKYSFRISIEEYFTDLFSKGCSLWLYLAIMASFIIFSIWGIYHYFQIL